MGHRLGAPKSMNDQAQEVAEVGCGCFSLISIFVLNLFLGGFCTQYVINFWAPKLVEHAVNAPFWSCALAGLFFGEITIPAAILTWLLRICGVV